MGGYGHLAYSYAPYAYAHHYGYYGLGHHYGYYGRKKREATAEADAEASPEADPWLLYGGYGLPYGGTTATATTTLPTLTSEAAATILADLSLVLEDKREGSYQRKIKIDSWNHVLISCFTFVQRVCQNIEIDNKKTRKKKKKKKKKSTRVDTTA